MVTTGGQPLGLPATSRPPLGGRYKPEHYATCGAAWHALGRPEADRADAELSDGQLRIRVRAYEREMTWAPPYVGESLTATSLAASARRRDAIAEEGVVRVCRFAGRRHGFQARAALLSARRRAPRNELHTVVVIAQGVDHALQDPERV